MAIEPEELPSANIRAPAYYIARARTPCPHCRAITTVTALALGPGHEIWDDDKEGWHSVPANAFLFHLAAVSLAVHARLTRAAPNLTFDSCWTNHCEHCQARLDDQFVHGEPGSGFTPLNEDAAAEILLTEIVEPFEASAAGYSLEPEFFSRMARR
jgi:hypothetical protein